MQQHNNIYLAEIHKFDDINEQTLSKATIFTMVLGRHFYDACRIAKSVFTSRFVRVLPLEG